MKGQSKFEFSIENLGELSVHIFVFVFNRILLVLNIC